MDTRKDNPMNPSAPPTERFATRAGTPDGWLEEERSTAALRDEIEHTRQDIDSKLAELTQRLSPRFMAHQAMDTIKETGRDATRTTMDFVRDHPVPAAVAAIGLGWLAASMVRDRRHHHHQNGNGSNEYGPRTIGYPQTYGRAAASGEAPHGSESPSQEHRRLREASEYAKERLDTAAESMRERASAMRERASEASEAASDLAASARNRFSEVGHHLSDTASNMRHQLSTCISSALDHTRDWSGEAAHRLQAGSIQARRAARNAFEEHPLTVTAAMVAAGVALGIVFPSSRKEDEWIGERRDDFYDRARNYGEQWRERGKAAATAAMHAAREEARVQHLTPREMKEDARAWASQTKSTVVEVGCDLKDRAEDVVDAARHAAEDEFKGAEAGYPPERLGG